MAADCRDRPMIRGDRVAVVNNIEGFRIATFESGSGTGQGNDPTVVVAFADGSRRVVSADRVFRQSA